MMRTKVLSTKANILKLKEKLFISNIGEKQAVRMNGKKWAVDVRLPFPDEKIWKGD